MTSNFFKEKPLIKQARFWISLVIVLVALVVAGLIYTRINNSKKIVINQEIKPIQQTLDTRFLILYGKVSKVDSSTLSVDIIKEPTLTDYVFDNMKEINIQTENNTVVKRFNTIKNTYSNLKISDIKVGDFITTYINNSTSTGYVAIGVKVFDVNIIK